MNITIHSQEDFKFMRKAGRLAAETLDFIAPYVKIGVTTNELNDLCHDFIINASRVVKWVLNNICASDINVDSVSTNVGIEYWVGSSVGGEKSEQVSSAGVVVGGLVIDKFGKNR